MSFAVVIPARHGASRLPGKPLRRVGGMTLIQHAWEVACRSGAGRVVVATDDERIAEAVTGFGGECLMTAADHASGTDRVAEVARRLALPDDYIVVNLQCDEPQMPAVLIDQVAAAVTAAGELADMATLATPIRSQEELINPNVVKVVRDARLRALYFSRAPIPWARDVAAASSDGWSAAAEPPLRHIGLYAFRVAFLQTFVTWAPVPLEQTEALEQLRALWHGCTIRVEMAKARPGVGVDTEQDLQALRRRVEEGAGPAD